MAKLYDARWIELCRIAKANMPPICWLCGGLIDRTLSGRHPDGWTGDHVIPKSVNPSLMYDYANIRPAHLRCNSRKGNGKNKQPKKSRHYRAENL